MISANSRPGTPVSRFSLTTLWEAHKQSLLKPSSPAASAGLVKSHFAQDFIEHDRKPSILCVPTGTGGKGLPEIEAFVRKAAEQHHTIQEEKVINRVVSGLNLVEEALLTVIHEEPIHWLLPEVKPTRRRILVPTCTCVTFNDEGRISSKRVYWDQASVLKQIGVLPMSLFCKANNSETVLPILGNNIVTRLAEDTALNLGTSEIEEVVEAQAEAAQAYAKPPRSVATSILPQSNDEEPVRTIHKKPSISSIVPVAEEEPVARTGKARPQSYAGPRASVRDGNGYPSGEDFRPSTRLFFQPGGKPSNIFSNEPEPTIVHRRNPNWSSAEVDPNAGMPTTLGGGRKHYDAGRSSIAFEHDDNQNDYRGKSHATGKKHHAERALQNNDIFGTAPVTETGRGGRRDPNTRSVESDQRPSSRGIRPPGGGTSFSLA